MRQLKTIVATVALFGLAAGPASAVDQRVSFEALIHTSETGAVDVGDIMAGEFVYSPASEDGVLELDGAVRSLDVSVGTYSWSLLEGGINFLDAADIVFEEGDGLSFFFLDTDIEGAFLPAAAPGSGFLAPFFFSFALFDDFPNGGSGVFASGLNTPIPGLGSLDETLVGLTFEQDGDWYVVDASLTSLNVSPVPEPAEWLAMLAGLLALIGYQARREKLPGCHARANGHPGIETLSRLDSRSTRLRRCRE